jgi:hypothetical protein
MIAAGPSPRHLSKKVEGLGMIAEGLAGLLMSSRRRAPRDRSHCTIRHNAKRPDFHPAARSQRRCALREIEWRYFAFFDLWTRLRLVIVVSFPVPSVAGLFDFRLLANAHHRNRHLGNRVSRNNT